jgi:hypothetical protein
MTALDSDALCELERFDIMNAASLIRDTLKQNTARWHLQEYHDRQKDDHMDVGGTITGK